MNTGSFVSCVFIRPADALSRTVLFRNHFCISFLFVPDICLNFPNFKNYQSVLRKLFFAKSHKSFVVMVSVKNRKYLK